MSTTVKATLIYEHTCKRCGHIWTSFKEQARQCPKCWARDWANRKKDGE